MSKDPFEELFGQVAEKTQPQPVPARKQLAHEQAERVRTAQLRTESQKRRVPGGPWIVVGVVVVVAIIVSIVIVNLARGDQGGGDQGSGSGETSNQSSESTSKSTEPDTKTNQTAPDTTQKDTTSGAEKKSNDKADANQVPKVDVGPTTVLSVTQWGVSGNLSQKFGMTRYTLENNDTEMRLSSDLISQLPCGGNWGAVRTAAGKYEVLKPAQSCAAAPELYDELWGLTDAFVKTLK